MKDWRFVLWIVCFLICMAALGYSLTWEGMMPVNITQGEYHEETNTVSGLDDCFCRILQDLDTCTEGEGDNRRLRSAP